MADSMDYTQAVTQIRELMRRFTTLLAPNEKEALRLGISSLEEKHSANLRERVADMPIPEIEYTVEEAEARLEQLCTRFGLNTLERAHLRAVTETYLEAKNRPTDPIRPPIPPESRNYKVDIRQGTPAGDTPDMVNHPPHYTNHPSGIECITIVEWFNYNIGNIIKYAWRTDEKDDPIENLRKAAWYANREIQRRLGLKEDPE